MTLKIEDTIMGQEKQKLSVILPIYNVESYIRQCLDSIVNQTYRNLEIILVDDGSPDNCGKICDEYAEKDSRIIVLHKQNGGVQAARNDGMAIATGEWLTFVDPDDWCEPDYYEQLFDALNGQDVDVFCSGGFIGEYINKSIPSYGFKETFVYSNRKEIDELMTKILAPNYRDEGARLPHNYGSPWDKIYKSHFLKMNDLKFDPSCKMYDDIWFNFQIFDKAQRVGGCTYIGYHYRFVASSISKGIDPQKRKSIYDFTNRIYNYMGHRETSDLINQALKVRSIILFSRMLALCYFYPGNKRPYKEIAKELEEIKTWPYFYDAIHNPDNRYMSKKQYILKYLLRLPWIWPLKLAWLMKK